MNIKFLDLPSLYEETREDILSDIRTMSEKGAFVGGDFYDRFTEAVCTFTGAQHAIGVSGGTAAVEIGLRAIQSLSLKPILPVVQRNTFMATVYAAYHALPFGHNSAKIILVNDWRDFIKNPSNFISSNDQKVTTPVFVPVHMYGKGHPFMSSLREIADEMGGYILEDAAQAHGIERVGWHGDVVAYSMYPTKNLGCWGQGGFITTNNKDIANFANMYIQQGCVDGGNRHFVLGHNQRLDPIQAIPAYYNLQKLNGWNDAKREVADEYYASLTTSYARPRLKPYMYKYTKNYAPHLYPVNLFSDSVYDDPSISHEDISDLREKVRRLLKNIYNIPTGLHYEKDTVGYLKDNMKCRVLYEPVPDLHRGTAFLYPGKFPSRSPVMFLSEDDDQVYKDRLDINGAFTANRYTGVITLPMHPFLTSEEARFIGKSVGEAAKALQEGFLTNR